MSDPTAVARQSGVEDVFVRGADNHLWHAWFINGWHGWEDLGGDIRGNPQVLSTASSNLDVFVRDASSHLVHRWWNGTSWSPWTQIGTYQLADDPDPVSWGPGRIDVYATGLDNNLIQAWTNDGTWHDFGSMGCCVTGKPDTGTWYAGHYDVFVRGTNNLMYHKFYTGSTGWSGWYQLGTFQSTMDPVVSSWGNGRFDIFVTGLDNAVDHIWADASGWQTQWESLGGTTATKPAALSFKSGQLDLFARGGDLRLWHRFVDSSPWSGWQSIGDYQFDGTPKPISWGINHQDVFVRGLDGAVDHVFMKSDGTWYDWQNLGVPTNSATWPSELARQIDIGALVVSFNAAPSDDAAGSLLYGLSAADRANFDGSLRAQLNDGDIIRDITTQQYYRYQSTTRTSLGTAAQAQAAGYNIQNARRFTSSALTGVADLGWASLLYGGPDGVNTSAEMAAAGNAFKSAATDADANAILDGLTSTDRGSVQSWLASSYADDSLIRDTATGELYYVDDGSVSLLSPSSLAAETGIDPSTAARTNSQIRGVMTTGSTITSADLGNVSDYGDPSDATLASSGWTSNHNPGSFTSQSADGKAFLTGEVRWYHGASGKGWRHRGQLSGVKVIASAPVGCIWAKVTWGFPRSSVSWPGSISAGPAEDIAGDYYVKCRAAGASYPTAIDLSGISDARAFLNSATVTLGTSATKVDGIRYSSSEKEIYKSPATP